MEHVYSSSIEYNGVKIIQCKTCGFRHVFPIPEQEELDQFYKEKYFKETKPFDYGIITNEYIENKIKEIKTNREFIIIYNRILQMKENESATSIIDIGCGNNLLAKYFQQNGWQAAVIEPSEDAVQYLKMFGLRVFNKCIEEVNMAGIKDIGFVNMDFVLEHLTNPIDVLNNIYKAMPNGSILRIRVPNDFNEGQLSYYKYFQKQPYWVCTPDHVNYFNFNSLKELLERIGFKEIYRTTNFPLEFLLMSGIDYYENRTDKESVGKIVANFESCLAGTGRKKLLDDLYNSLAKLGFGRAVEMYVKKVIGK